MTCILQQPLSEAIVVHPDESFLTDIRTLEKYVLEELNIQKLSLTTNKAAFGVSMKAEPDHKVLGLKFKKDFKKILTAVKVYLTSYACCRQYLQISFVCYFISTDCASLGIDGQTD